MWADDAADVCVLCWVQSPTSALFASLNPSPRGLNGSAAGLFQHLSPASMERGLMGAPERHAGTSADGSCLTPITRELARAAGGSGGGGGRKDKKRDLQIMIPATASVKGDVRRCSGPGPNDPRASQAGLASAPMPSPSEYTGVVNDCLTTPGSQLHDASVSHLPVRAVSVSFLFAAYVRQVGRGEALEMKRGP
jgi:hypothetical protein